MMFNDRSILMHHLQHIVCLILIYCGLFFACDFKSLLIGELLLKWEQVEVD